MSDVYDLLVRLLASGFGLAGRDIRPDDTLDTLELDSLALVELILVVKKEFGVRISDDDLTKDATIARVAELIAGKGVAI
jgi:acyl carrier protein